MTLTIKLEEHMKELENRGADISSESSTRLLQSYYRSIGVSQGVSFTDWIYGIGKGKYPAYGSVTRAIRKCRELTPKWRKGFAQKQQEVDDIKKAVGY